MNPIPPNQIPPTPLPGGVWPPPPMAAQPQQAPPVCPFKWVYRRIPGKVGAKAHLSDIREGYFELDSEGIVIQGQVIPRAEIRTPVIVLAFLGGAILAVMANYIMENGMQHPERIGIRWSKIQEIFLAPDKQQAGFIYEAPNYAGKVKTFCLVFTPAPGYYEMFAQAVQHYAPQKTAAGRLKNATPLAVWIFLGVLLAGLLGLILWATLPSGHH